MSTGELIQETVQSKTDPKPIELTKNCELTRMCADDEALWQWIKTHLGLQIPRRPFCEGHRAPFDYLSQSYFETGRDLVVWGPRGGGKTRLAAVATLLDLLHKPGITVRVLGGSLEQSLRVWEHLIPDLEKHAGDQLVKARSRARRVELLSGASAAVLTQSQRAVRGQRVQKMRCDEVDMFDSQVWAAAGATTRSMEAVVNGKPMTFHGTVEALSTHHKPYGLMSRVIAEAPKRGAEVIHWCILDVMAPCGPERSCDGCALLGECGGRAKKRYEDGTPVANGFVPVEDVLRLKSRMSAEMWDTEMLCNRPSREGRVFPHFDVKRHVCEFPEPAFELSLGVDFGYSAPFVALWIGMDGGGVVHVVDEYVVKHATVIEHGQYLWDHPRRVSRICCDPAGGARNEQTAESSKRVLQKLGFKVSSRRSQIQEGVERIRLLCRSGDGRSRLRIHPRCKQLIRAMEEYHYPEDKPSEVPDKDGENDHLIDAFRYWAIGNIDQHGMQVRTY